LIGNDGDNIESARRNTKRCQPGNWNHVVVDLRWLASADGLDVSPCSAIPEQHRGVAKLGVTLA